MHKDKVVESTRYVCLLFSVFDTHLTSNRNLIKQAKWRNDSYCSLLAYDNVYCEMWVPAFLKNMLPDEYLEGWASRYLRVSDTPYPVTRRKCRAIAQAVSRWLPNAAARVRIRAACGFCGRQSGTGASILRVLRFPLPIIIPPISPSS
jgi:hypothetical protein